VKFIRGDAGQVKGDISGAIANAIVVIPMAAGYGIIALAPLGAAYASHGTLMGLYSAVFGAFCVSVVGRTPVQMTGPKAPLALVIAALVAELASSPYIPASLPGRAELIIALTVVSISVAGLVQIALGVLRIGDIVKYIPHPVIAGFMNGIALLLILKQAGPFFGTTGSLAQILKAPGSISLPCLAVGAATLCTFMIWPRLRLKSVPAPFAALLIGTAVYYGFSMTAVIPGPVIGNIPSAIPKPTAIPLLFRQAAQLDLWHLARPLLLTGLFLGILGTMDSLLSAVVCGNLTGRRPETRQELIGQGVGNLVCALFNGLPGAGSVPGVMAAHVAGGRTAAVGAISGVIVLIILVLFGPWVGKIPLAVVAGIIIAVAVKMIDTRTLGMLFSPKRLSESGRERQIDLGVNVLVAILTVTVNLIVAVGAGLILASALFIARTGRAIIHRRYTVGQFRSRKMRPITQQKILDRVGDEAVVLELKGPLFFGASDRLAREIDRVMLRARYCILDMKQVSSIDSTGADILVATCSKFSRAGKFMAFAHINRLKGPGESLAADLGQDNIFQDLDAALEAVEDQILSTGKDSRIQEQIIPLAQMDIVKDFLPEELALFKSMLTSKAFSANDTIIRQGDDDRSLYLLVQGSVSVRIKSKTDSKRLVSFSPGVIFGELSMLDGGRRSAQITADRDSRVLELSFNAFETLQQKAPGLASKLITGIALWLSGRLKILSREIQVLERE